MAKGFPSHPTEEIVAQVNNLGLQVAAKKFGTSPATLSRWLKQQNYRLQRVYVLTDEAKRALQEQENADLVRI